MKKASFFLIACSALFAAAYAASPVREAVFPAVPGDFAIETGTIVSLPSLDGGTVEAEVGPRSISSAGTVSYRGKTSGGVLNDTTFVMIPDGFVATVADASTGVSTSFARGRDSWTVREYPPSRGGKCGTRAGKISAADPKTLAARKLTGDPLVDGSAIMKHGETVTDVVDVLVGFDKSAAEWVRRSSAFANLDNSAELFAADAIENCNAIYANTDLDRYFRFNLAGVIVLDEDLSQLRDSYGDVDTEKILDGLANEDVPDEFRKPYNQMVRAKREEVHADVVSFLVACGQDDPTGTVGIGFALDDEMISREYFADIPYNVCLVETVANGGTTMAHEIGHNMGAGHAEMYDADNSGPQLYDYSSGYYFNVKNASGKEFMHGTTVMGYDSDGYEQLHKDEWGQPPTYADDPDLWRSGLYTETRFFSSSTHTFKYVDYTGTSGILVDSRVPLGDSTHDNTRLLSLTWPLAANYRARNKCPVVVVDPQNRGQSLAIPGFYAPGTVVQLKASPAKGYQFAGWYTDYDGATRSYLNPLKAPATEYRMPSISYKIPETSFQGLTLFVRYVDQREAQSEGLHIETEPSYETAPDGSFHLPLLELVKCATLPSVTVKGLPAGLKYDAKTGDISGKAAKPGLYTVSVAAKNPIAGQTEKTFTIKVPNLSCDALPGLKPGDNDYGRIETGMPFYPVYIDCKPVDSGWKVSASGLPAGLKFDAKSNMVVGVPVKPGTYTVTFTAAKGKEKQTATITLNVFTLPGGVAGTFSGFLHRSAAQGGYAGTFNLVSTDIGKLTAKITTAGGAYSFSANEWNWCENGMYKASFFSKKGERLEIEIDSEGSWDSCQLSGMLNIPDKGETYYVSAQRNALSGTWYFKTEENTAGGWTFFHAGSVAEANASVSLKSDGVVALAGKLGGVSIGSTSYADVSNISAGELKAGFAPIVSVKDADGKAVKKVLTVNLVLPLGRSRNQGRAGTARFY